LNFTLAVLELKNKFLLFEKGLFITKWISLFKWIFKN
jgi:hypothetical protein